jgi:hypothetical protein
MTLSLNSKEGRSILTSLSDASGVGGALSPEAGRNLVGTLGFRLVGIARQIFQSPDGYQAWLETQRKRVAEQFIAICKNEVSSSANTEVGLRREGKASEKNIQLSQASLDKLRAQSSKFERPRVLTPSEFENLLTPRKPSSKSGQYSGLQRFLNFINPFDRDGEESRDWLTQFRASGQALKIEMSESLESYYDLLQSKWNPVDVNVWVSIGAHLIQVNDELAQLCQSAEDLLLSGLAKDAGFNLSLIFALLKGLASERAVLTYLIAHHNQVQGVQNWDEAIAKARAG